MWPNDGINEWAFHEAGHAVAMLVLDVPFTSVGIREGDRSVKNEKPHPDFVDAKFSVPEDLEAARQLDWSPEARDLILRSLVTYAAGPVAQMYYEGKPLPTDVGEFYLFGGVVDASIARGYSLGLAVHLERSDEAILGIKCRLIREAVEKAGRLVRDHWPFIDAVARRLITDRRLSADDVSAIADLVDQDEASPPCSDGA